MPQKQERSGIEVQSERAVLAAVRLPDSNYDKRDPFGELRELAEQAGAVVVGELTQNLDRPVAGTYMGAGKVQELGQLCDALDARTIIFDHDLSPKQIAKIEEVTRRKVIDRSELILDIFASRATTAEAKLQVELAQLEYTYPRLRAMWDHLERIVGRGGIGGVGTRGPGEQQLEIDRRLVQERRDRLRGELEEIQRRKRREVAERRREHFTVGIVGYTNAGKSTLFNNLTAGGAYADDRLFATLMTRTRAWDLGAGRRVLLSDTVGFVRDLPHNLIASFKATLEEATHADLLLIVLDVSDPAAELHWATVNKTLDELFADMAESDAPEDRAIAPPRRVLLLNKCDLLQDNRDLLVWQSRVPGAIPISALAPGALAPQALAPRGATTAANGVEPPPIAPPIALGHDALVALVREAVLGAQEELTLIVPLSDGKSVTMIENRATVLERDYSGPEVRLRTRIGRKQVEHLRAAGARFRIAEDEARRAADDGAWSASASPQPSRPRRVAPAPPPDAEGADTAG